MPGLLTFSVDLADTVSIGLLQPLRVIRVNDGTNDIEAYIVRDQPGEWVTENERPAINYQCDHLLTWLGYGRGGAALWPYGGLTGLQQSPRWFGPYGFDFPTLTGIPEPTTDGALTRENWQDPLAERFVFTSRAVYRRYLTGTPALAGPARMWFTSAAWTVVRVWFDGAELTALSTPLGDRSIRMLDLPYDGEDHVICFDCEGTPPSGLAHSLGWTWAGLSADSVGEFNDWGQMENRIFTTFNSTTYSGPTAPTSPYWQAWEDYDDGDYPGCTVGFVRPRPLIDEAQTRGLLAIGDLRLRRRRRLRLDGVDLSNGPGVPVPEARPARRVPVAVAVRTGDDPGRRAEAAPVAGHGSHRIGDDHDLGVRRWGEGVWGDGVWGGGSAAAPPFRFSATSAARWRPGT